jgi:peptide/nickel transport system permease protein
MTTELSSDASKPKRKSKLSRIRRYPILAILILLVVIIMALFANFITSQSPLTQDIPNRLQPPVWAAGGSWDHPLGTDRLGRDLLTRIIYGARISLIVALVSLTLGAFVGLMVGVLSGYFGGWVDAVLMRVTDSALAIPTIFLALLLAVTLGASFTTVIIAISLVVWSSFARTIRGDVLRVREYDYVALARVAGCSNLSIIVRHIIPNVLSTFLVLASLQLGAVVLMESMLSFLGAGIPPPTPSWGSLVADGREYISSRWWISVFPGLCITLLVLSLNMLGDWIRDTLDPKLRQAL